ncbi:inositol oxygenase [Blyttiomyces helicus]|uniref:Inositol oxygenase n=1 Tax=Blyttiomyces helicus TaxID=388810 RepID=A0A4P9W932_9FUNG|nr:inositol oxygenase [Blyttiomyces helicus]|eukprot:RKO87995.1 inositol oxygenase [Blyttiomyces helicus]
MTAAPPASQRGEDWEAHLLERYPAPTATPPQKEKEKSSFRDYSNAEPGVVAFYKTNHELQTLALVLAKKEQYGKLALGEWTVWEGLERLNALVDESDPDTSLSQIQHAFQSAEAARRDNKPRWFQLVALIHDLGKLLFFEGEPQHLVVGDTFPVGCRYSDRVIFSEFFVANPDFHDPALQTVNGIYEPGCGLDRVHLSWGHDEYLYQVMKDYLPVEALYTIRYHSFYAAHREYAYQHLFNETDHQMMQYVREFNPYDLYSKGDPPAEDDPALVAYYKALIDEFVPGKIKW